MKETFTKAIKFILTWEGGYVDDINDMGGETNYGISKRSYPNEDIKNMTIDRATEIYYQDYWLQAGCEELPSPLDMVVMDTAVNMGMSRAKKILEQTTDWKDYILLRIDRYSVIASKDARYLRGWINRCMNLYKTVKA
jgi:lysozyme family protein